MGNSLRGAVCLAGKKKISAVLRRMMVPDWPGNELLAFLQLLGCMSYMLPVTVAHSHYIGI